MLTFVSSLMASSWWFESRLNLFPVLFISYFNFNYFNDWFVSYLLDLLGRVNMLVSLRFLMHRTGGLCNG